MKISELQIQDVQKTLNEDANLKLYLEEACEMLHLSLQYDSDFIFDLLNDDVFSAYDDHTISLQGTSHKFEWKINAQGFKTLSEYALQREYFLTIFHKMFFTDFIRYRKGVNNDHK